MKKYDVLTIADLNVDLMVWGKDIDPEFTQREKIIDGYKLEVGGSAPIFACQCGKLGLKTAVIGTIGRDAFGDLMIDKMKESNVDVSMVKVREDVETGFSLAMVKNNNRAILTVLGGIDATTFVDVPVEVLKDTRHLHIASYYLLERMQPSFLEMAKIVKQAGGTVSIDTNFDPSEKWSEDIWELISLVDIFMPNETELLCLMKEKDMDKAMKKAVTMAKLCVVKNGAKGALCMTREGELLTFPPMEVVVKDTVGAGDTFDAGFLYGWLNGKTLEECGRIGTICSAGNVTRSGGIAGQPRLEEVLKRSEAI